MPSKQQTSDNDKVNQSLKRRVEAAATEVKFDLSTVPASDRDRVEALIPDPRIAEFYVHRYLDGFEDFDLLDGAIEDSENVLLRGPTGSSKTTFFRAYSAARGLPFYVVECNGAMDPGVILGRTTFDETSKWVDGDWTLVIRYGGCGLIDEINMAHPRITAAYHQLLAVTRRMSLPEAGETIHAGHGGLGDPQPVLIGAAYNPRYDGTVRLNSALKNRFAQKHDWGYERAVEEQLITSVRLLEVADNVRSLAEIRSPLSTNMLMEYERHVLRYNAQAATRMLLGAFEDEERNGVFHAIHANEDAITAELVA
jgi:MoxR-like ATPase